jgi:hypothetical protein
MSSAWIQGTETMKGAESHLVVMMMGVSGAHRSLLNETLKVVRFLASSVLD